MWCVNATTLFLFNGQKHKEMESISKNNSVSDAAGKKLSGRQLFLRKSPRAVTNDGSLEALRYGY